MIELKFSLKLSLQTEFAKVTQTFSFTKLSFECNKKCHEAEFGTPN